MRTVVREVGCTGALVQPCLAAAEDAAARMKLHILNIRLKFPPSRAMIGLNPRDAIPTGVVRNAEDG